MSVLSNLRMVFKVGLIATLMGVVMFGLVAYMASGLTALDEAYGDMVKRVDASAVLAARSARKAETYREAAFELLTETTDAGLRIVPVCPFVAKYLDKHDDFGADVDTVTPAVLALLENSSLT